MLSSVLEHALAQCRAADIPLYLPAIMATLGLAYARSGQVTEALHLLDQVEVRQTTGGGGDRIMLHLGEGVPPGRSCGGSAPPGRACPGALP